MKLKNIPNILSFIRIGLVFVFIALFFTNHIYLSLLIFLLAGATDVVDGYLARKFNWITNLGKILDRYAEGVLKGVVLDLPFQQGAVIAQFVHLRHIICRIIHIRKAKVKR